MKRQLTLSLLAAIAVLSVVTPAEAQQYSWNQQTNNSFNSRHNYGGNSINTTQAQLQARINQGIASGRLSQREASKLQAKLAKVAQLELKMRNSGNRLNRFERARLDAQLLALNAKITIELNDFDRRRVGYFNNGHRNNWTR